MSDGTKLASATAVTADDTLLVTLQSDAGDRVEAILTRSEDGVVAYRNYCSHWTDVRLDRGPGAPIRNGEIRCRKHGATFEKATGYCNFGPCEGATLEAIDVVERDGDVYLTDPAYTFCHRGPAETDHDLSTNPGERLGF